MSKTGLYTTVTLLLLAFAIGARSLQAQIKLYLKNGTYEIVKSYEVQGDRVRYYSLERSDWEEVPKALVDFDATQRAQQEEKAQHEKQIEDARELEHERFDVTANTGYEIQPGVRLPSDSGVYAFDGTRVIRLIQSSADVVTDKKRAALVMVMPGPLLKKQSVVMLAGAKAAVRILSPQPDFYIQDSDTWAVKAELLPLAANKNSRVVERIRAGIGVGKPGEVRREGLPLERTRLAAGVYKLKPTQPLAPGEYALGEMMEQKLNIDVWDFGIDSMTHK